MAQPPQTLPADFFDKQPPSELPPDFFEKKAKARTPAETKEFLKRYAPILNQPGLARQLATGAGKQLLQDSVGHLDPVGPILEMKDAVQGKPHTPRGMAAVTAPSGEGEEAGGLFMQGAELLLPAPKMAQAGYEAYQGWKEGRAVSKAVKSERIKRLAKDALEGPKTGKGLKPPKSGGLAPQFDEGASRLPPRKGFTPPPDDPPVKAEPFKPSARTAKLTKSGGPPESFDMGARRTPPGKGSGGANIQDFVAEKGGNPKTAAEVLPSPGKKPPVSEPKVSVRGEAEHAVNRADAASNIAKELKRQGLNLEGYDRLLEKDPDSLHTLAKQLGHKEVSHPGTDPGTWHQVRARLKRLMKE